MLVVHISLVAVEHAGRGGWRAPAHMMDEPRTSDRSSAASSTDWDGLSTFLGDSDEEERIDGPSMRSLEPHDAHIAVLDHLTHDEFAARFRHQRPCLLRGFANGWPALSQWSDATHLRSLLPDETVTVLRASDGRRFLKRDCTQERWSFAQVADVLFAATPPAERIYARAPLRGGLRAGVCLRWLAELVNGSDSDPAGGDGAGWRPDEFKESNCAVWLGSAGCVTPLHYDLCHGFLVGVRGTKHITYYPPEDYRALYPRPEQPELAQVDLDLWRQGQGAEATEAGRAERAAHPRFADATAWHAVLAPGDVLYTPPFHWHHVETAADEAAVSVLVPFDPRADEPVHACHFR